ncbi:fimbrial protein StdA [Salmonella enterica subsp. enterica serovar Panama]|nr:fimbrial protein StdA [Salmonella enterica subsp. enterica serovar Panama]
MFKKHTLAFLAAATMIGGTSAFAATPTMGPFGSGTIHFTGTITNSPCSVAPGDDALVVPFGQISYRDLDAADKTTASHPIVIHLTGCAFDPDPGTPANPAGLMSKAQVAFTGAPTTGNKAYANAGSARNVGVQLLESDNNTPIEANYIPKITDAQQLQAGDNQLRFFARLIAVGGAATPGSVDSTVTYTLTYL